MRARHLLVGMVLVVVTLFAALRPTSGQSRPDDAKLADKYLKIYLKSDPRSQYALEDVHLRELGGQQFLVGVGTDTGVAIKWHIGLTYWVATSDIATIQVHHTRQGLKETYKIN